MALVDQQPYMSDCGTVETGFDGGQQLQVTGAPYTQFFMSLNGRFIRQHAMVTMSHSVHSPFPRLHPGTSISEALHSATSIPEPPS